MAGIRNESRRGFTLVELLTVVAIIGLLIAVLVPVVRYAQIRARNAAVASQLSGMATGLELFKSDFGYYPSSLPQTEDGVNAAEDRTGIDATTHKVQGFHRVAFALVGRDRLGCPAKRGTGTGLASTSDKGPDSISGWYYSENKGSF